MLEREVVIHGADYWFKVVAMLQQNWALIETDTSGMVVVYFIQDRSGVFDRIRFDSVDSAKAGLRRNGFARYLEDEGAQRFIKPPTPPYFETVHPNGPIYSSGKFWK